MIAFGLLLSFGLLLITVLNVPIRVRFESNPVCYITWLFLKFRVRFDKGEVKTDIKLFNKKTRWFGKKKPTKKKEPSDPKKEKKKKKQPKITKDLVLGALSDIAVKRSMRVLLRFCRRCLNAVRVSMLHGKIGLKDFYWQGIITGLLHSLPRTDNLRLSGNFLEENDFTLELRISILKISLALTLLLLTFPYLKAYRLYRRVYL